MCRGRRSRSTISGGKVANFERVEWIVQPDPATAAAALQTGEVDWLEFPVLDLLPMLRKSPGCDVVRYDPLGSLAIIAFNHLYPPFDNPKLLRALLPAIDQQEYVTAWVGEQQDLGKYPVGFFTGNSPMENNAGMEAFTSPRDLEKAKKLVAESGYNGEKIVMMAPSDQPSLVAPSQVSRELFIKLGLNVDYQVMDWGTLVARRAKMDPPSQGGWNVFHTTWGGLATSNPGSSFPLRGNGKAGLVRLADRREDGGTARPVVRRRATSRSRRRSASRSSCRRSRAFRSCRSGSGTIRGRSART